MRPALPRSPLLTLLGASLALSLALAPGARADGGEPDPIQAHLADVRTRSGVEAFARCNAFRGVVLNEVCAVGTECDRDVRVADFVELYNASGDTVDLACFVLTNIEGEIFAPEGEIEPGGIKGFGEGDLRFRLRKANDEVALLQLGIGRDGAIEARVVDAVPIDATQAHSFRMPDGGTWRTLGVEQSETGFPGTFGRSNRPTAANGPSAR